MSEAPLLQVQNLQVHFSKGGQTIRAVDGVSFSIGRGRTLGLVGESGCGKSTTGYALLRLIEPTGGRVLLDGIDLATLSRGELRRRRRRMQLIFQDAAASLDPRMPIGDIISEALAIHGLYPGRARAARVRQLLDIVGIPSHFSERYPHQLSGGQAQRIAICRALAVEPELIVCDEPVSALDVSIQAQIINLMQDLQNELNLSYLFISHDLSVVRHISHEVAVMYLGRIAEWADRTTIFREAAHPYTAALLSAVPIPDPDLDMHRKRIVLKGDLPSPADPPPGCRFAPRCPVALPECTSAAPAFRSLGPTHSAACIRISSAGNPA